MHQNVINAAVAISAVVRLLNADEFEIMMKYTAFISTKFANGEIKDADEMLIAIDEFAAKLINEEI